MKLTRDDKIEIFENAISWIVVLGMFVYGCAKIVQFDGATNIEKTVSQLTGMELMWAFYGYSKAFAIIIGVLEVTGGTLIFFKRTRILGCLFISTILINIIIQDIVFEVNMGALRAALLYQFLVLVILFLNKNELILAVKRLLALEKTEETKKKWMLKIILGFLLFVLLRIVEFYVTH